MAYNPGVTDISGQLRAAGKVAQAEGIASGFSGGFQAYQQNKLRNQVLQSENEGLLKAFLSDPETAKYAPAGIDKFLKKAEEGGGMSLKDNMFLNGALNTALKTRGAIDQQNAQRQMMQARAQEMEAQKAQQAQATKDQQALASALSKHAQLGTVTAPTPGRPPTVSPDFNPQVFLQDYFKNGGSPASIDKIDTVLKTMMTPLQQSGGAPTSAMKDTDAIIYSELEAGKLKSADVQRRKAELLAAGGRDPGDRFDNAGTFVDAETGTGARTAVKNRATGQIGFVDDNGEFKPLDQAKWKPSTTSDTNALLDPPGMEKLRTKVLADENSIKAIGRYLKGVGSLEQGAGQLADRLSKNLKTLFTNKPLTEEEKATGLQSGRLQQIIGGIRTTIVGPGVMTEQDAQRIIDAVGGDVTALQNQEVMKQLIGEILSQKIDEYDSDLDVYNTHVARKYGGQAGYKQRTRVPTEFVAEVVTKPAAPAIDAPAPAQWDEAKEKRLQELRSKLGK
jgi:hypothetical protein